MGKRGSENSQLSKEEYEALEDGGGEVTAGSYRKASAKEMAKRRVVKVNSE